MKHLINFVTVVCLVLGMHVNAYAATPTDINYSAKGSTTFGTRYTVYTVRCSDGSKKKISSWNKRKKWCIGRSQRGCTNDQLKTAKKACNS